MDRKQKCIYEYLKNKTKGAYLIEGEAGTGKTYLACQLIEYAVTQGRSILVLCPTHQAKHQFSQKVKSNSLITLNTVASFLWQYPVADETGELRFLWGAYPGTTHQLIIVDEVSMVSQHEMAELLQAQETAPIVFLGDFAQLRPVMKKQCDQYSKLKRFKLTTQHRNADTILQLAIKARQDIIYPTQSVNNITVHLLRTQFIADYIQRLLKAKVPHNVVYLAYRNVQVDAVGRLAHQALYGDKPFVIGQYIRLDERCLVGNNGDIVKIKKVNRHRERIAGEFVTVYDCRLFNANGKLHAVQKLVPPKQQAMLKQKLEELYLKSGKAFKRDKAAWEEYQAQIKQIRGITFYSSPYAQTVHRAQGRSILHVYVDTRDISTGHDRKRLLYVAYSRAVKRLHTIRVY